MGVFKDNGKIHTISDSPETGGRHITPTSLIFVVIAAVVTVMCLFGLTKARALLDEKIEYEPVVVAKTTIPERFQITKDNRDTYLEMKDMDKTTIPEKAIKDPDLLINMTAIVELGQGEVITSKDIEDSSTFSDTLTNPIELSINIGAIENTVAGKIRQGDLVNISLFTQIEKYDEAESHKAEEESTEEQPAEEQSAPSSDTASRPYRLADFVPAVGNRDSAEEESDEAEFKDRDNKYGLRYDTVLLYHMDNVYILKAYTSDGVLILPGDTESNAGIITFRIEKEEEENFNNAVATSNLVRISRNVNKDVEISTEQLKERMEKLKEEENETESPQ